MNKKNFSNKIALKNIKVNDPFWNGVIDLVRREVIPYQYEVLHDRIEGAEKSYCIENFVKAGKISIALKEGKTVPVYPVDKWCYDEKNADANAFHGWVFQDSDAYKWLEAAAYSLVSFPDSVLEEKADGMIDIVCSAALENGYLDTLYIINDRSKIFTNLRDFHELYCFGHLAEAAVAYYQATGKRKLLDAALRFADLICQTFGSREGQKKGYGGHEIAELALVKLYEVTGDKKYLDTAKFLIDERGKKPYYFDTERGSISVADNYFYHQAHTEPRRQREAVGHAVRGVYLYSGMADVAKYCNDEELYTACKDIWNNIENKKLYITGGIGATVHGEAFSFDYDLPNDLAYSETCAAIGLIFFAKRMAQTAVNARYSSVAERALYNTVLAGLAEDGKRFFYVNPLEVNPEASKKDERKKHIKPVRQKWFSCACCPPNLARLISSVGEVAFSENEETVFIHQYIGGEVKAKYADIKIRSDYANSGTVDIRIVPQKPLTLTLRIPEWNNNKAYHSNTYQSIKITKEQELHLDFMPEVKVIKSSNRVRANIGKAAVMRGPFVYCAESADNGADLQMLRLDVNGMFTFDGETVIADGYRETPDDKLYFEYKVPTATPCKIKLIPYYRWGNRGENEMTVYLNLLY